MGNTNRKISKEQQKQYAIAEKYNASQYMDRYNSCLAKYTGQEALTIIDVGGGGGYFAHNVKDYYSDNGIDAAVHVIDYCQYDEWSYFSNVNFIRESAFMALDKFLDASVDIIFLNLFLHHLVTDTYAETRKIQLQLLKMAYKKIKVSGCVCIYECNYQSPLLRDISIPVVYYMSTNKSLLMISIARKLGSRSAGVGVCFLSKNAWLRNFSEIGFKIDELVEEKWNWNKKFLIREQYFKFILRKGL